MRIGEMPPIDELGDDGYIIYTDDTGINPTKVLISTFVAYVKDLISEQPPIFVPQSAGYGTGSDGWVDDQVVDTYEYNVHKVLPWWYGWDNNGNKTVTRLYGAIENYILNEPDEEGPSYYEEDEEESDRYPSYLYGNIIRSTSKNDCKEIIEDPYKQTATASAIRAFNNQPNSTYVMRSREHIANRYYDPETGQYYYDPDTWNQLETVPLKQAMWWYFNEDSPYFNNYQTIENLPVSIFVDIKNPTYEIPHINELWVTRYDAASSDVGEDEDPQEEVTWKWQAHVNAHSDGLSQMIPVIYYPAYYLNNPTFYNMITHQMYEDITDATAYQQAIKINRPVHVNDDYCISFVNLFQVDYAYQMLHNGVNLNSNYVHNGNVARNINGWNISFSFATTGTATTEPYEVTAKRVDQESTALEMAPAKVASMNGLALSQIWFNLIESQGIRDEHIKHFFPDYVELLYPYGTQGHLPVDDTHTYRQANYVGLDKMPVTDIKPIDYGPDPETRQPRRVEDNRLIVIKTPGTTIKPEYNPYSDPPSYNPFNAQVFGDNPSIFSSGFEFDPVDEILNNDARFTSSNPYWSNTNFEYHYKPGETFFTNQNVVIDSIGGTDNNAVLYLDSNIMRQALETPQILIEDKDYTTEFIKRVLGIDISSSYCTDLICESHSFLDYMWHMITTGPNAGTEQLVPILNFRLLNTYGLTVATENNQKVLKPLARIFNTYSSWEIGHGIEIDPTGLIRVYGNVKDICVNGESVVNGRTAEIEFNNLETITELQIQSSQIPGTSNGNLLATREIVPYQDGNDRHIYADYRMNITGNLYPYSDTAYNNTNTNICGPKEYGPYQIYGTSWYTYINAIYIAEVTIISPMDGNFTLFLRNNNQYGRPWKKDDPGYIVGYMDYDTKKIKANVPTKLIVIKPLIATGTPSDYQTISYSLYLDNDIPMAQYQGQITGHVKFKTKYLINT